MPESEEVLKLIRAYTGEGTESGMGEAIRWKRVHNLPDYAYFDHAAHVTRGVSCVSCHGRIDAMEVVTQAETLSMGWCLHCHRDPNPHLRPLARATQMDWLPEGDAAAHGARLREALPVAPAEDCSTCHR